MKYEYCINYETALHTQLKVKLNLKPSMSEQKINVKVGVLALQGSFKEHESHLKKLFELLQNDPKYSKYKLAVCRVKDRSDLDALNGIILCGGESTTTTILLQRNYLLKPLRELITKKHLPAWGTCCGLILLSNDVTNNNAKQLGDLNYECIGGLDVTVSRNSFGRQLESFTEAIDYTEATDNRIKKFDSVFIRAPTITKIYDNNHTRVLATITKGEQKLIVGAMNRTVLGTSFHPELVQGDYRFHEWFLDHFVLKNLNS